MLGQGTTSRGEAPSPKTGSKPLWYSPSSNLLQPPKPLSPNGISAARWTVWSKSNRNYLQSWTWQCMSVNLAFWRWRQEDGKFNANLGYIVLKTERQRRGKEGGEGGGERERKRRHYKILVSFIIHRFSLSSPKHPQKWFLVKRSHHIFSSAINFSTQFLVGGINFIHVGTCHSKEFILIS